MSKRTVRVKVKERTLCMSDLGGTFNEALDRLKSWKDYYESNCSEGEFCVLSFDFYGYDGASELTVKYYRYETDEEYLCRLDKEQKMLETKQEKEINQLKTLKEKYKHLDI